jgi:GrpB-like predicted nucleotidyltransferase (UPF0157 family)
MDMSLKNITVVPHNPNWARQFLQESALLAAVFGDKAHAIDHIGSTSIPFIYAKPIIDILIQVKAIDRVDALGSKMTALNYLSQGENGLAGRRYFVKGGDEMRSVNVHAFQIGHPEISRCLDFRDYLRAFPEKAQIYSELKQSLAARFPHDIDGYMAGKDDFIKNTIVRARVWRQESLSAEFRR